MLEPQSGSPTDRLLDHADWVRSLARSLVSDPDQAEDVVQETWLAALKRRGSGDRLVSQKAWLGTVLRNFVTRLRRSQARREERERLAASSEPVTEEELSAEHLELHRQLVEAVQELDEPSRTVVLMRYFDGLAPREIAQRLDLPGPVVRKRLSRSLERLRQKMDRNSRSERSVWSLTVLDWLELRLPAAAGSSLSGGAWLVTGWVSLLAVLLSLAWVAWQRRAAGVGEELLAAVGESGPGLAPGSLEGGGEASSSTARGQRVAVEAAGLQESVSAAALSADWIEGRVILPPAAPPDDSLSVRILVASATARELSPWLATRSDPEAVRRWVTSAAWRELTRVPVERDGCFRFERPEAESELSLAVDGRFLFLPAPLSLEASFVSSDTRRVELRPVLGAWLQGALAGAREEDHIAPVDLSGVIVATRQRRVFDAVSARNVRERIRTTRCEANGRFELRGMPCGDPIFVGARTADWAPSARLLEALVPGEARIFEIALTPGLRIGGRTLDDAGQAVSGVRVVASSMASRLDFHSAAEFADQEAQSDEQGRFELGAIAAGGIFVHARREGFMWSSFVPVEESAQEDGRVEVELVLPRGASLGGRIVWPDGSPAGGAAVEVSVHTPFDKSWVFGRGQETETDEGGHFRVSGLARGTLAVRATAERAGQVGLESGWVDVCELRAEREDLELELEPSLALEGQVTDEDGVPLECFEVHVARHSEDRLWGMPVRAPSVHRFEHEEGRFRMASLAGGDWELRARAPGFVISEALEVHVEEGQSAQRSGLHLSLTPGRRVIGRVSTPDGDPVPRAKVTLGEEAAIKLHEENQVSPRYQRTLTDDAGRFEFSEAPAAAVRLSAAGDGWAASVDRHLDLRYGEGPFEVVLGLREAGRVHGRLTTASGEPVRFWHVWLAPTGVGHTSTGTVSAVDGRYAFEDVPAGDWKLVALPSTEEMRRMGFDPDNKEHRVRLALVGLARVRAGTEVEVILKARAR